MTVTLTMDDANARVQIGVNGLGVTPFVTVQRSINQINWTAVRQGVAAVVGPVSPAVLTDAFGRVVVDGWGSADSGQTWINAGGAAADYDVDTGVGKHTHTAVNTPHRSSASMGEPDGRILVDFTCPVVPTGNPINARIQGRSVDANNYYGAWLVINVAGSVDIHVHKVIAGVSTTIAGAFAVGTHSAGNTWKIIFQFYGTQLKAKAWKSTDPEPAGWSVETADGAITAGTDVALWTRLDTGNTNGLPVVLTFDNLTAFGWGVRLTDYEYVPGVINYYRATPFGPPVFISVGAAAHGDNASVVPPIPPGALGGDALYLFSAIRSSGVGVPDVPGVWVNQNLNDNIRIMRKTAAGTIGAPTSEAAPTCTYTGGAAGDSTSAQIMCVRNTTAGASIITADKLNVADPDIAFDQVLLSQETSLTGLMAILWAWKQNRTLGTTYPGPWVKIADADTTLGSDQGITWAYAIQAPPAPGAYADIPGGVIDVAGSGNNISRSNIIAFPSTILAPQTIVTIVPSLDRVWLKSPARPFLNRRVTVVGFGEVGRPARSTDHDIVGRSFPVAVSDLRGSRRWALELYTGTADDAQTMDFVLASGDVLFVHTPAGCKVPGGYVRVGDTSERRPHQRAASRVFTLPCIEVVPPGPDVGGAEGTWASVLAAYASWSAVLAAFPTWADLLALVGTPSEVIVP